jgi:hypothetical protein
MSLTHRNAVQVAARVLLPGRTPGRSPASVRGVCIAPNDVSTREPLASTRRPGSVDPG